MLAVTSIQFIEVTKASTAKKQKKKNELVYKARGENKTIDSL